MAEHIQQRLEAPCSLSKAKSHSQHEDVALATIATYFAQLTLRGMGGSR